MTPGRYSTRDGKLRVRVIATRDGRPIVETPFGEVIAYGTDGTHPHFRDLDLVAFLGAR